MRRRSFPAAVALCVTTAASAAVPPDRPRSALDWGFAFASAIESDEKDRARAQEAVALERATAGDPDGAAVEAGRVEGWRQGVAYAEVAAEMARRGRPDDARVLLAQAEGVRSRTEGWQGVRVESHILWARTLLGDPSVTQEAAAELAASDKQYSGKAGAAAAVTLARHGRVDEALEALAGVDAEFDPESAWWKFHGHVEASRVGALSKKDRRRLLDGGRAAASELAPWQRAENLPALAAEYRKAGRKRDARACLEEAETIATGISDREPLKGPIVAEVARGWAAQGDPARARRLLGTADPSVDRVPAIEQPAVLANLAGAWNAAGDDVQAGRLLDEALTRAAALENARPRALAVVEICRAMARFDLDLTQDRESRLEALRNGLGDPW
jgi:hypothetical protein